MAPRDIHKEEEIEEFAISRKNHGYLCYCYELLAWSFGGQHCTNDEAVQRSNLTEWEMHGFVRARKTVLENDGLQVWCCEAQ